MQKLPLFPTNGCYTLHIKLSVNRLLFVSVSLYVLLKVSILQNKATWAGGGARKDVYSCLPRAVQITTLTTKGLKLSVSRKKKMAKINFSTSQSTLSPSQASKSQVVSLTLFPLHVEENEVRVTLIT